MLALKSPATRRAVLDLLSIGLAPLFIIEEDPLVETFGPLERCPQFVCPPARTIQRGATSSTFVSASWVGGLYRNTHYKTGVKPS